MTWFKVDDSFYDHPKVFALPDSAVALWTRAGCWSARNLTDGVVPARLPARLCDDHETAVRALVDSGLWTRTRGGYRFHDWDVYQPSKEEVTSERARKSSGGRVGNHRRWHVERGIVDPDCAHCRRDNGSDNGSDSDRTARVNLKKSDRSDIASRNAGTAESSPETAEHGVTQHRRTSDNRSHSDRSNRGDTESDPNPPVPSRPVPKGRGSVGESSSPGRRTRENDDDDPKTRTTQEQTIDRLIIGTLQDITGRTIPDDHATRVRHQLLDGRQVANPMAYVAKAIRERPNDFLPADLPPPIRDEPWMRDPAPDQEQINARGRAAVEEARKAALAGKAARASTEEG